MAEWRLALRAEEDLISIAQFGDATFGKAQSDDYRNRLKRRFERIADNPFQYPTVEHIRAGYRRSVCGVHSIYFRIDPQGVLIVRVLGRQDPKEAFDP